MVNRKSPAARFCAIFVVGCRGTHLQGLKIGKNNICMLDLNFSLQPRRKQGVDSKAHPEFGRFRKEERKRNRQSTRNILRTFIFVGLGIPKSSLLRCTVTKASSFLSDQLSKHHHNVKQDRRSRTTSPQIFILIGTNLLFQKALDDFSQPHDF